MAAPLPTVAFFGLGIMGAPMAGHVLTAGYPLRVYSRTRQKADELVRQGARWCETPREAGRGAAIGMINVTDGPDVESVVLGEQGLAHGLEAGSVVIDFSTISPEIAQSIAARLSERGILFLDAPVTGGQVGARNAALTILVGGPAEALERVRPLLNLLGKKIIHAGPNGAGQALKSCNQILCAVNMMGVCEALLLARQAGVDPRLVVDGLGEGAGGSWALRVLGEKLLQGDLQPAFMIKLMQKDLRIVQDLAERAAVTLPATALAQHFFHSASRLGGEELGTQAMMLAYEALAERDPG